MTDLRGSWGAAEAAAATLRARQPATSVIAACLSAQAAAPHRSALGRVFGASPLSSESHRWYASALGELRVAEELEKLGPSWVVFNSVAVGERGHVIDHLVIGPGGVFAVSVIHHQDSVIVAQGDSLAVNCAERPYLDASRDAATDAAVILTRATGLNVPVRGLLVFIAPRSLSVRDEPDDVGVTSDRALHRWLTATGFGLSEDSAEEIADAAAEPSTWRGATGRVRSLGFNPEAFEALRVEVQRARLARGLWTCAILGTAVLVTLQLLTH